MIRGLAAALLAAALSSMATVAECGWLITPEEAARAGPPPVADALPAAAEEGPGPLIVVMNPKALERLHSPVNILVRFEAGGSGEPPDMQSLTVTLRGFISIDITDRLRAYLLGATLAVREAELPVGNHRIRLMVADVAGNLSARDVTLIVVATE